MNEEQLKLALCAMLPSEIEAEEVCWASKPNPKTYSGSPLTVNLKMFNVDYERYAMINRIGHFFIKGEGDINYVDYIDSKTMNNITYSHITDFKVNQLCFYNLNTDTEQVLFG
jgi:hypothetical protein